MYKKGRKEGRKYLWPIWKFLHHQSSASATVTNSTSPGRMCLAKLKASRYLEQHITLAEIAVNTSRKCTHTLLVWCLGERRNDHLGMNTPIIIIKSMETLFKREREGGGVTYMCNWGGDFVATIWFLSANFWMKMQEKCLVCYLSGGENARLDVSLKVSSVGYCWGWYIICGWILPIWVFEREKGMGSDRRRRRRSTKRVKYERLWIKDGMK